MFLHLSLLQHNFTKKNEKEIKKFGMYQKYDDSQDYLIENRFLVCEETANFLVLWCIDLEVREVSHLLLYSSAHVHFLTSGETRMMPKEVVSETATFLKNLCDRHLKKIVLCF